MRVVISRARLAAAGLAIAAVTIIALAAFVLIDLTRQAQLNAEVVVAQEVKDHLYALRAALQELRSASRLGARTGDAQAFRNIERRALDVETELHSIDAHARAMVAGANELAQAAQLLVVHARSVRSVRGALGGASADALSQQAERLAVDAVAALDRALAAQTERISERTRAQVALAERLRSYVAWLLAGSIAVLVGLFAMYRRVHVREREAQARIERLAHFDVVTGLPNRSLLSDRLAQEAARARRGASSFALLAIDLDGFKAVNDTFGHAAGDAALIHFARIIQGQIRSGDIPARIGGEEFAIWLPKADLETGARIAERIRIKLGTTAWDWSGRSWPLSASFGVAACPETGRTLRELPAQADAALYVAKQGGRNRVERAGR